MWGPPPRPAEGDVLERVPRRPQDNPCERPCERLPAGFPTASHKGPPPAALPQKAPAIQCLEVGGASGGTEEAYLATPAPGPRPQEKHCAWPLTIRAGGPQGWDAGAVSSSHPGCRRPAPPALPGAGTAPGRLAEGLLRGTLHSPTALLGMGPTLSPLPLLATTHPGPTAPTGSLPAPKTVL